MTKSIFILVIYLVIAITTSCKSNINNKEQVLDVKDSCLYMSILNNAKDFNLKTPGIHVEKEYDSIEVLSSLRRIYYDTVMNAFSQTTRISIIADSINKIVFSEYLFDSNYYQVIKRKEGGLWLTHKIEGPFWFKNDTGEVHYPGVFILKGPPNILIARNFDTSFTEYQTKFLFRLIPLINNCRGTSHW